MSSYMEESERTVARWQRDAEGVLSENMAHVIALNAFADDCDHEAWLVCGVCGRDLGGPVDE